MFPISAVRPKGLVASAGPLDITTWNPSDKGSFMTLSNGNKTVVYGPETYATSIASTPSKSAGKLYAEIAVAAINDVGKFLFGFLNVGSAYTIDSKLGMTGTGGLQLGYDGNPPSTHYGTAAGFGGVTSDDNQSPVYAALLVNDVIGLAFDFSAGKAWFSRNNSFGAGSPAAGTNPVWTWTPGGSWVIAWGADIAGGIGGSVVIHGGIQAYPPPAGFSRWDA